MAEDTQRSFSDGTAYEQFMGRWTCAIGTIFLDWLAPPTDARWLDIGCGTGVFTDLIVSTCSPATVVAIDPSGATNPNCAQESNRATGGFPRCGRAGITVLRSSFRRRCFRSCD